MNLFEMTVPEIPKKEFLLHNRIDLLNDDQKIWWDALVRLSDVLSLTMQNHTERTTGSYLPMLFTEFLEELYTVIHTQRLCGKEFVFDDFISIATFSVPALKHIVSSPSTQIVKNAEKVHVSSLRQTSSKTMQWMARRPGRSVQEKIAPENKVMTNVTHFSTDTKENREALYLYTVLHDIVRDRIKDTNCLRCEFAAICGVPTRDIRDLLSLHAKIRHGELSDVRPEKQTMQNNKLMCDVNYKMVWDGVKQLSRIEDSLKENWENLQQRYLQLGYWAVLAEILHDTDTAILDSYGTVSDDNGVLTFCDSSGLPIQNSMMIYPSIRPWEPLLLELNGSELSLYEGNPFSETLYFDLASISLSEGETVDKSVDIATNLSNMEQIEQSETTLMAINQNEMIPDSSEEDLVENNEQVIPAEMDIAVSDDETISTEKSFVDKKGTASVKLASKNEVVFFGRYQMDQNGLKPIVWNILCEQDDRLLLISKYGLETIPFDESGHVSIWEDSTLRAWLNEAFLNTAFTAEEQDCILLSDVDNGEKQNSSPYKMSVGSATYDKVFLLSAAEVNALFPVKKKSRCSAPTPYAASKGAYRSSRSSSRYTPELQYGRWWLRNTHPEKPEGYRIDEKGTLNSISCNSRYTIVRPAIWVTKNCDFLKRQSSWSADELIDWEGDYRSIQPLSNGTDFSTTVGYVSTTSKEGKNSPPKSLVDTTDNSTNAGSVFSAAKETASSVKKASYKEKRLELKRSTEIMINKASLLRKQADELIMQIRDKERELRTKGHD